MVGFFYWDPSPQILRLPWIGFPILWYSVCFLLGFIIGYEIFKRLISRYFSSRFCLFSLTDVDWKKFQKSLARNQLFEAFMQKLKKCFPPNDLQKLKNESYTLSYEEKVRIIQAIHEIGKNEPAVLLEEAFSNVILKKTEREKKFSERILVSSILATIIGARLFHLIFYQRIETYFPKIWKIFATWEGGLASHGAAIGVFFILFYLYFSKTKKLNTPFSLWTLVDWVTIPALFVGALVRIGNFFNQEILGKATTLPFAVIFGHPQGSSLVIPRHPVQIYEALFYFGLFCVLMILVQRKAILEKSGLVTALFFFFVFTFRFLIEFLKEEQSAWMGFPSTFFTMGQYLSIPFALFGLIFTIKKIFWNTKQ